MNGALNALESHSRPGPLARYGRAVPVLALTITVACASTGGGPDTPRDDNDDTALDETSRNGSTRFDTDDFASDVADEALARQEACECVADTMDAADGADAERDGLERALSAFDDELNKAAKNAINDDLDALDDGSSSSMSAFMDLVCYSGQDSAADIQRDMSSLLNTIEDCNGSASDVESVLQQYLAEERSLTNCLEDLEDSGNRCGASSNELEDAQECIADYAEEITYLGLEIQYVLCPQINNSDSGDSIDWEDIDDNSSAGNDSDGGSANGGKKPSND